MGVGGGGIPRRVLTGLGEVQASAGQHLHALSISSSQRPEFTNRFQIRASALIFLCADPSYRGATAHPSVTIKMNHV